MGTVRDILTRNEKDYGSFKDLAGISQTLKTLIDVKGEKLSASQTEALEMIMVKIARILNGNPDYIDNWVDIAGYAQLVVDDLQKEKTSGVDIPRTGSGCADTLHTRPLRHSDCFTPSSYPVGQELRKG